MGVMQATATDTAPGSTPPCYHPVVETPTAMATTPDRTADARWVRRARDGEVGAFEELHRLHAGRVYALCLRMTGDAHEAEELAQEAFVRAWEKLPSFGGRSAFSSWLHRLTVNVVLGRWRSRGRRHERVVAIHDAGTLSDPVHETSPRDAVDLERAIAGLPKGARTVFVLHDVEGYRHREIAELTGLSEGTSKAQLHRARRLLREVLRS
jgi:RNA polymerase sigma-70 factor (ECF subfamily)